MRGFIKNYVLITVAPKAHFLHSHLKYLRAFAGILIYLRSQILNLIVNFYQLSRAIEFSRCLVLKVKAIAEDKQRIVV